MILGMKGRGGIVVGTRKSFKEKDDFSLMIDLITSRIIIPRYFKSRFFTSGKTGLLPVCL